MEQEDNCIKCGKKFGIFDNALSTGASRSDKFDNGDNNICIECFALQVSATDTSVLDQSQIPTNQSVSDQTIRPNIEAGGTSILITMIGWIGIVISLIGVLVALLFKGTQALGIPFLVLFEMSVMVLGFGILVGNSDKLVGYAKQMANKES